MSSYIVLLEQPNRAYSASTQIRKVLLCGSQPSGHKAWQSDCASGHNRKEAISSEQMQPRARAHNLEEKAQAKYQSSSAPSASCPCAVNYLPNHMRWVCQPETTICSKLGLNHQIEQKFVEENLSEAEDLVQITSTSKALTQDGVMKQINMSNLSFLIYKTVINTVLIIYSCITNYPKILQLKKE